MIEKLRVQNFRKHRDYGVEFAPGINLIIGPNGSGKTSLIEAIHITMRGKSWRSNFGEITKKGATWWRIDCDERTVKFQDDKKVFEIDHKKHFLLPEILKKSVVLFEPQDLNLLYSSPARRRDYIDNFISGLEENYRKTISKYNRILKQRNSLLKKLAPQSELFVWDIQFAKLAAEIVQTRKKYLKIINKSINEEYQKIAKSGVKIALKYQGSYETEQEILGALNHNYQYETIQGCTSVGPHQHDILFLFNKKTAVTTISRGENRSLILALKNLEYSLKKSDQPLILLDDVLSEFDEAHQKNLLATFKNEQVIITGVKTPTNIKKAKIIKL